MWTKLGSFSERVREHAKSAAQVAQGAAQVAHGVLQAAAAEEEPHAAHADPYAHPEQQYCNQNGFEQHPPQSPPQSPPPPASPPPPPPPASLAPPPIPQHPPNGSAELPLRSDTRRARYVVAGIAAAKPQASALAPPVPTSFVTPEHPPAQHNDADGSPHESQFVSQHTSAETLSHEAATPETDMHVHADDVHGADASQPNQLSSDLEPVSDVPSSPQRTFEQHQQQPPFQQLGQQPQQTVQFTTAQPAEEQQPPEAHADGFIDWGDDDWNLDADDQYTTLQHEAGEMYSEQSKPLAGDTGADVDWFSVQPSKPQQNHTSFLSAPTEPTQVVETNAAQVKHPSHPPDSINGAQQVLNESVPRQGESQSVSSASPEVHDKSIPFALEPSAPITSHNAFQPDPSANVEAADEAKLDNSLFTTHDESQQQPPPEEAHNLWMSSSVPDPVSPVNELISEKNQPFELLEEDTSHQLISTDQETTMAQGEIAKAAPVYATSQEHDSRSAYEMEALRSEIQRLTEERDKALAARSDEEQQNEDLKRSILTLKDDLEQTHELNESLAREKDSLLGSVKIAVREKQDAEAERDAAIERGGDGIKEAHGLIEVMRGNEDAAREREARITEQIETMRSDLERISSERNSLVHETDELQRQLRNVQSQAQLQEEQLKQQLKIVSHEREIADLEREKALESIKVHAQEYENLYADERDRLAALQEKDLRIQELERTITSREKDKEEEDMRIDLLSGQIQEMKDHTHEIIEERNSFYQAKLGLENEIESFTARHEQVIRELQDAKRESASFKGERDEARTRYASMRDQNAELRRTFETLSSERDRLIQKRTAATASSDSVSEREVALAQECEEKTRSVALMQRKITSLSNKIEKLAMQRGTFQRQRDEASTRLRAAGEEFMTLHSKLESIANERDGLKTDIVRIREERDNANFRVQELSSAAAEHLVVQEKLQAKTDEVEEFSGKLERSRREVSELLEKESSLKQKSSSLANELSQLHGRMEVLQREKDSAISLNGVSEQEKTELRQRILQLEEDLAAVRSEAKTLEADLRTSKETSGVELGIVKTELLAEQKSRQEASAKLAALQNEISPYKRTIAHVHDKIRASLQNASAVWEQVPASLGNTFVWPEMPDEDQEVDFATTARIITVYSELLSKMVDQVLTISQDCELTKQQLNQYFEQLTKQAEEQDSLQQVKGRCTFLEEDLATTQRNLQNTSSERDSMRQQLEELTNALTTSKIRESELDEQLRIAHETFRVEIGKVSQASTGEVEHARKELQKLTSSLETIWGMIQKSLDIHHLETFTDDGSEFPDPEVQSNVGVHVLRGTASLVAELSRARSHLEELGQRCQDAENKVERLTDRAEIAEQERDALRGSNERLERKANNSRLEGLEEAKKHYESVITQIEDELEDVRHNLERMTDKSERSENEAGELRALCTKLTSQLNSRTNELDEAEEKNVYLQDQVTTLGEDLEEAHRRLQEHEEESAVAQREEVERLTSELRESSSELEKTLELCSKLQSTADEAEAKAKECELLAETHRQAEENLRIAIEQLEAAQDSLVEQRTIEMQRELNDMDSMLKEAKERVSSVNVTENKLMIQDEEIKELRGAIGRLADERVELKLELEKSLSRLNHPDAGGQLVDRRVVRQLLVSYFRVGSVRKRDVLELMSRMLAFSESDNIAVGLKRRALIDRLGSLVQAPELDDASLPPIGTVSDKWIEFLMKETEEGEEQAKGW